MKMEGEYRIDICHCGLDPHSPEIGFVDRLMDEIGLLRS